MKFFIDTADVKEIREAHALGLVDGVTTNPSLVAKESGKPFSSETMLRDQACPHCGWSPARSAWCCWSMIPRACAWAWTSASRAFRSGKCAVPSWPKTARCAS